MATTTTLAPYTLPFTFSSSPTPITETTLTMKCHDRTFSKLTVLDASGHELYTGEGNWLKSMSWRRTLKDSTSGSRLFDLRHAMVGMKNLWTVENPDGQVMATLKHVGSGSNRSDLDMVVGDGDFPKDVVLQVRQRDRAGITTEVRCGEKEVAEVTLLESNDVTDLKGKEVDRSAWGIRVAGGVDPAVILVIALCRAEMHHVWRQ